MDYRLQEGCIQLPPRFEDRTVNVFVPGDTGPVPLSITVSRDRLMAGESLHAYVARQLKLMASRLPGYTVMGQVPVSLSNSAPVEGLQVDAHYVAEGRSLYQRQAAFILQPGRALVFAATAQAELTSEQNRAWGDLLASFKPHPASAHQE